MSSPPAKTFSVAAAVAAVGVTLVVVLGAGRSESVAPFSGRGSLPHNLTPTRLAKATAQAARSRGAPTGPPVRICGNAQVLDGPRVRPRGAIRVRAGYDNPHGLEQPHRTYWFAPGRHTLGSGEYSQIVPGNDSTYTGAPGATIDGEHVNDYAFTQHATGVTIEHLTIENFGQPGGNGGQGVVNHDSGSNWRILDNTIEHNAGAGVMLGTNDVLSSNCLTRNGEYGFSVYSPNTPSNVTVTANEVSYNDTDNWEQRVPGCGCAGGAKFWKTKGAVVTKNFVHNNFSVGLWADTDNTGFLISQNYISNNFGEGIMYEISYNAYITRNTLVNNAWGEGPTNPGFPTGGIYISESGGDSTVPGAFSGRLLIANNVLADNWSGVVLWENANRFCGSPDNSSTGTCTMGNPAVANINTCTQANLTGATISQRPDYYDLCRWKTKNVLVKQNTFMFWPADIPRCAGVSNSCGENALFSEYGTSPSWSPYQGSAIEKAITFHQGDRFASNTYVGPWRFMAEDQASVVGFGAWQHRFHQDLHSKG